MHRLGRFQLFESSTLSASAAPSSAPNYQTPPSNLSDIPAMISLYRQQLDRGDDRCVQSAIATDRRLTREVPILGK